MLTAARREELGVNSLTEVRFQFFFLSSNLVAKMCKKDKVKMKYAQDQTETGSCCYEENAVTQTSPGDREALRTPDPARVGGKRTKN